MTINLDTAAAYSILGIIDNAVFSKTGSISACFYLDNPEPYTLDETGLQQRHIIIEKVAKTMIAGTYVHKQDVFLKRKYDPARHMKGNSFLQRADMEHFKGRQYLEHFCILAFTLEGLDSLEPAYIKNPLAYKEGLTRKDKERLREFLESVEAARVLLKNLPDTTIRSMEEGELRQYMFHFVNGFADHGLSQIRFDGKMQWGDATGAMFTISDEQYLPDQLPVYITDDTLPKSNTTLNMAVLEKLGVFLPYNHICNQVIYCEGSTKLKAELEKRVILVGQHRRFAKDTALLHAKLDAMQTEVLEEQALLCRSHFSLLVWDEDPAALDRAKDMIRETLKIRDILYFEPQYEWLRDAFIGTILGRVNKLHRDFYFLTDGSVAAGLFLHHSTFRDDPCGAIFCDRVFQKPLFKDIWDEGKRRLNARNGIIVSGTGGGKSSTALSLVEQDIIEETIPIVVEFGSSFKNLARLYSDVAAHVDYDGVAPLGVNPFYIHTSKELTPEKIQALTILVLKFWRKKEIREDTEHAVSLNKMIADYYEQTREGHSFPDFYNFVKDHFHEILARQEIKEKFFEIDSFLHVCGQFLLGGMYASVCMPATDGSGYEDKLRNKKMIVFELTRIKKDPFLVSVILAIIMDTVENKILFDRSKRGKLYLDEYGETATMTDSFTKEDVHSTVAFYFQKFRKENGAIYAIIQTPDQLPQGHFTDSMIGNTHLLYVLPTNEKVYDAIEKAFKIKNTAHINLMKSISNDFNGPRPYSEIFIRFAEKYATVVRLEFSREKFYAFQTDGPDWQKLENDTRAGIHIETAIKNLLQSKNYEKSTIY